MVAQQTLREHLRPSGRPSGSSLHPNKLVGICDFVMIESVNVSKVFYLFNGYFACQVWRHQTFIVRECVHILFNIASFLLVVIFLRFFIALLVMKVSTNRFTSGSATFSHLLSQSSSHAGADRPASRRRGPRDSPTPTQRSPLVKTEESPVCNRSRWARCTCYYERRVVQGRIHNHELGLRREKRWVRLFWYFPTSP